MEQLTENKEHKSWFDRYYKFMSAIPVLLVILCLVYLGFFYSQNKDFINKDVSLTGGTTITLTGDIDTSKLESELSKEFSNLNFRKLTDLTTGKPISFVIESSAEPETLKAAVEKILGIQLTEKN